MSNDEINRLIEEHNNRCIERLQSRQRKKIDKRARKEWLRLTKKIIFDDATKLSETGIPTLESVKVVIKEYEEKWEKEDNVKATGVSGYVLIGIGFLVAIGFMLGFHGISVIKGFSDEAFYGPILALIFGGVILGTIFALCYGAMEDDEIVAGWVYLILIIIFGILGIIVAIKI